MFRQFIQTIKNWYYRPKTSIHHTRCPDCSDESFILLTINDFKYQCPSCLQVWYLTKEKNVYCDIVHLRYFK